MCALSRMFVVCVLLSVSSHLWAHGGVVSMGNECKLIVGPYSINFSGYQPQKNRSERFCDDLPVVGDSIIVLDFFDKKLRDMTVNFRVIKADAAPLGTEEDGKVNEAELAQTPFFEIPAKHYPSGTMIVKQSFTEKGHFIGYVIVEDKNERFVSRFPFSVGYPKNPILKIFYDPYFYVACFVLIAILSLYISQKRTVQNKKNKSNES